MRFPMRRNKAAVPSAFGLKQEGMNNRSSFPIPSLGDVMGHGWSDRPSVVLRMMVNMLPDPHSPFGCRLLLDSVSLGGHFCRSLERLRTVCALGREGLLSLEWHYTPHGHVDGPSWACRERTPSKLARAKSNLGPERSCAVGPIAPLRQYLRTANGVMETSGMSVLSRRAFHHLAWGLAPRPWLHPQPESLAQSGFPALALRNERWRIPRCPKRARTRANGTGPRVVPLLGGRASLTQIAKLILIWG
ncbi:hypothetical protein LY76DRAFT_85833 [Colletotrichum caudatum]|nr:hypothetical protein LY76DRAFT_85833 [Colletotrichum caudatum]